MCFLMDPQVGREVCYVQFPQRFDGIDRSDRYANRNTVFFDVSLKLSYRSQHFDSSLTFPAQLKRISKVLNISQSQFAG